MPDGARGCHAAVRVVPWTYGTGLASIVPVPCTYGVGLGAPAVSRKVIVTSAFDICRVGDTVVSGRRKTGPDSVEVPCGGQLRVQSSEVGLVSRNEIHGIHYHLIMLLPFNLQLLLPAGSAQRPQNATRSLRCGPTPTAAPATGVGRGVRAVRRWWRCRRRHISRGCRASSGPLRPSTL